MDKFYLLVGLTWLGIYADELMDPSLRIHGNHGSAGANNPIVNQRKEKCQDSRGQGE